jgi:predicted RNase H-like HicB family nuclease
MDLFVYPARVTEPEPGEHVVQFRDIPEAIAFGSTMDQALEEAFEALEAATEGYLAEGRPLPADPQTGEILVSLEPTKALRAVLVREMDELSLNNVTLARRLRCDEKAVRRMLSGQGASFNQVSRALSKLGVRTCVGVIDYRHGTADIDAQQQHWKGIIGRMCPVPAL